MCLRDAPAVPVSEIFEAELELLELLPYKPIMSKGYQCMMHIHTVSDEVQIKELLRSFEKNEKGDVTEKEMPKFVKAHTRLICRIQTRIPVPLEKHDVLP
jgi:peptide chain release factor subunit 3